MISRKLDSIQRDLQQALLRAQIAALEAQRAKDLWALPVVREVYVPDMIDLPLATYQQAKREGKGPQYFGIGRRTFVSTSELRAWLEGQPKTTTTKGQRTNEQLDIDYASQNRAAPPRANFAAPLQTAPHR